MPAESGLFQSRAGLNLVLTNIAQGFTQPEFVMKLLFPLVEVGTYGGNIIQFDDSAYEDVTDDRADDTPYPEIQQGYEGRPFKLRTKGLSYRVPDKRRKEMENLRMNWDEMAVRTLMDRAGMRHEIEAATIATTVANYATANRATLTTGSQWNDAAVDPDIAIRTAQDTIAGQIGMPPNVAVMGQEVFSALAAKYARNFTSTNTTPGIRAQLTLDAFGAMYGFERVVVCRALRKVGNTRQRIFGKHFVMGYSNPQGLNAGVLPYRIDGSINAFVPAYGYTYVMQGQPQVYDPYYDNDRSATVYKLDFDRSVEATGVNSSNLITHGYLVANAVA